MAFTLGEKVDGLDAGQYIVVIDDVEAGMSRADKPKIQFTSKVAMDAENGTKAGKNHTWSYTYAPDQLGIISRDLLRSGAFQKSDTLTGDANADARTIAERMRGGYFVLNITPQKSDPQYTNTNIVGAYGGGAAAALPATPAPVPPPTITSSAPIQAQFPQQAAPFAQIMPNLLQGGGHPAAFAPPLAGPPSSAAQPVAPPPVQTQDVGLNAQQVQALQAAMQSGTGWPALSPVGIEQLATLGWNDAYLGYKNGALPEVRLQAQTVPTGYGAV